MACGCSKTRSYTQSNPLLLGEEAGEVMLVRATVTIMGIKPGVEFWVFGTGVPPMLDAGWLQAV